MSLDGPVRKRKYLKLHSKEHGNRTMGERVQYLMLQQGWTFRALAERMGTNTSVVYRMCGGHYKNPSVRLVLRFARALKTTAGYLID